MPILSRIRTVTKAMRQLGFTQVALNALYRVGLKTGYFRIAENRGAESSQPISSDLLSNHLFSAPSREQLAQTLGADGVRALLVEADEIIGGRFRQFGADPIPLHLAPAGPLAHWAEHENKPSPFNLQPSDPKLTWEPARFGWAFVLGRAYRLSGNEIYAEAFWRHFETFDAANPSNRGPNWTSGQEVGIRLMTLAWAGQIFSASTHSTPERLSRLATSIAQHARRIPPTLLYARSQNNNHLLTEAAALYTASLALPQHPDSAKWQALGQKWLVWCFTHQIDRYGEYVQHSTNYHRLVLQTALWVKSLENREQRVESSQNHSTVHGLPPTVGENLALATHWLLSLLDPDSGRVPNLGANDGALIFPLSTCPFDDYRPVAQAAAQAFLGYNIGPGLWDEMSLWFGVPRSEPLTDAQRYPSDHIYAPHSWAYLRAVEFKSRPSHADQLHLDLWWRGLNIAQDAGTYLYNAAPPWDNRLTSTLVHNTVSVDGQEQMTRAGRFLYLDWANAIGKRHFESGADFIQRISAQTDAYTRLGIHHNRTVTVYENERWLVEDELSNPSAQLHTFRLHWLLPDWEWALETREQRIEISLNSPIGWIYITIQLSNLSPETFQPSNLQPVTSLIRAGEYIHGSGPTDPIRGWVSPTYAHKVPALSLAIEVEWTGSVQFITEFKFPTVDREP